jgi:acyl-CoA synthetase (AMP-forming)/AMP-acid ligase II
MALRPADLKLSFPSLVELLEERARLHADTVAYTFLKDGSDPVSITYGELDRRARAVGRHLAAKTSRGDRVLLLYPPGLDFVAGFFGSMFGGVVPVPLPLTGTRGGFEKIVLVSADTGARLALTTSTSSDDLRNGLPGLEVSAPYTCSGTGKPGVSAVHLGIDLHAARGDDQSRECATQPFQYRPGVSARA